MRIPFRVSYILTGWALCWIITACNDKPDSSLLTPTILPPDPVLATPQFIADEEPLQGGIPKIPNIFIVPSSQSKSVLATFLHTTPEQLDWVNPALPDPISPGTLVVIPQTYRVNDETLSEVAQNTGLSEDLLRAANPDIAIEEPLAAGTLLVIPPLYIAPTDLSLSSVITLLNTSREALLAANPNLTNEEEILAGTLLVAPVNKGGK